MARYHFNPDTGRVGICKALVSCRFGQSAAQHGATREEARENYEASMHPETFANTSSKSAADSAPKLVDISTLRMAELPEGMDELREISGSALKSYALEDADEEWYLGGRHRVLGRSRQVDLSGSTRAWQYSVETDGERHTMLFPLGRSIPAALKYTAKGRERNAEHLRAVQEEKERWESERRAQRARTEAIERIAKTPYEGLSAEDRIIADELRSEEEEKRWEKNPQPLRFDGGSNRYGNILSDGDSMREKVLGASYYDLNDYNRQIKELAESDLPREEQELKIRGYRMDYIRAIDSTLELRMEAAKNVRAGREGLRDNLRYFFRGPDERDRKVRARARERALKSRENMLSFAKELFAAPLYSQVSFGQPRRF